MSDKGLSLGSLAERVVAHLAELLARLLVAVGLYRRPPAPRWRTIDEVLVDRTHLAPDQGPER